MDNFMDAIYKQLNSTTVILISLSLILIFGFLLTRLTKLIKLPNVSGYILAGVLIGPCVLNLIPQTVIDGMGFMSDIALAFIAFGVGKFFKKEVIREAGAKIIVITLFESLAAGIVVTLAMFYLFHMDLTFSLILGAIATATAPASTMMTIHQYKAKGNFVNTVVQVVALDDVVCLLIFSVVTALFNAKAGGTLAVLDIVLPILFNIGAIAVGFFCGFLLSRLLTPNRSQDNRLILVVAFLLGISGLCASIDISPLLACMVFGATYINLTRDKELFRQINNFTPPIMSIFFIVSGMNLDLRALGTFGVVGVAYFLIRIAGKYLGSYLGGIATKSGKAVRNLLGLALVPQAGVAIGLAFLGKRILPDEMGGLLLTIILSSSVLYELIGPACAKAALFLSGDIPSKSSRKQELDDPSKLPPSETAIDSGEEQTSFEIPPKVQDRPKREKKKFHIQKKTYRKRQIPFP